MTKSEIANWLKLKPISFKITETINYSEGVIYYCACCWGEILPRDEFYEGKWMSVFGNEGKNSICKSCGDVILLNKL